jgi:magnesium transporter
MSRLLSEVNGESPSSAHVLCSIFDAVGEHFLDLVDGLESAIDGLEDEVTGNNPVGLRARIAELRHTILRVRRVLAPTRDAARRVVDDRLDLESGIDLFDHSAQLRFADTYDKLLRATDGIDLCRDLLAGVRDFLQAEVANSQNEVMKRLTVVASLLLLPTFIVGLYGQNLHGMPEVKWHYGYAFSWGLIVVTTIGQLIFFRRRRWI